MEFGIYQKDNTSIKLAIEHKNKTIGLHTRKLHKIHINTQGNSNVISY